MHAVVLVVIACLSPGQCKETLIRPIPKTDEECYARAAKLQETLAGTIGDDGYRPIQAICKFVYPDHKDGSP